MTRYAQAILLAALAGSIAKTQPPTLPDLLLLDRGVLEGSRQAFRTGQGSVDPGTRTLMQEAEEALRAELVSVTQKEQVPPSGDKHDYMSLGPYWWPDSTRPGGLPYVRRDGEVNPEYRRYGDNERIGAMVDRVRALALAYAISGEERYAEKAVRQVRCWFLDRATRMNPHLEYAQAIRGVNQGRGIGIIETYSFRYLVDALLLLKRSPQWTHSVEEGINIWFNSYLTWLLESQNGKDEAGWKNNHGSAYDVQVSCIALFLGKAEIARRILKEAGPKRVAVQIEPDGSQPLELERTKSWGYSNMNLDALIELAGLGKRFGVDLWGFATEDGRSIRRALEFLLPYALGERKWGWVQIVPMDPGRMYFALRMAAHAYDEPSFASAARAVLNEEVECSLVSFYLPPQ